MDSTHATTRQRHAIQSLRGFTLIEACVVVTVLALIACAAAPGLQDLIETRRLNGAATTLLADLQYVRNEAVARNQPLRVSFFISASSNCYVVHSGGRGACSCMASEPTRCVGSAAEIKTVAWPVAEHISLQANVSSILFDPLHGTSTPAGTVRVIDPHGRAIHHVINVMGRVRSCSPAAAIAGYRAC